MAVYIMKFKRTRGAGIYRPKGSVAGLTTPTHRHAQGKGKRACAESAQLA